MFKVHVNDGSTEIPKDDICYIVAKEGIFLKKKMGIMDSIAPVDNISILESVSASAKMHIPPIPATLFAKVIDFFGKVYDEYRGEAIVLLFYNEETQKYRIVPPSQKVSGASLDYNRSITIENYTMIGDIHSHGSMSAFHSGTDDDDERSFDGLHITIGNANSDEVSISGSIVANGYRFMVDPADYVAGIKLTKDEDEEKVGYTTKIYKTVNGKLELDEEASKRGAYTYRKMDKRYVSVVPPSKRKVSESWMDKVERGTYVYTYGYGMIPGRSGGFSYGGKTFKDGKWQTFNNRNWGNHYDSHAWQNYHKVGTKPPVHAVPPITTKPHESKAKPMHLQEKRDDEFIPCLTCLFRDEKILLEEGDDLDDEFYKCSKCGLVISGDSDELTCPNCKTDNHLTLIEDKDLEDNSVEVDRGDTDQKKGIRCPQCFSYLQPHEYDDYCPFCFYMFDNQTFYDSGAEHTRQQDMDSGAGLDPEAQEANEKALQEAEKSKVSIPDPQKREIPIPVKTQSEPLWKTMLKKAFTGEDKH